MGNLPTIIQGGMGAGVSSWRLARSVSRLGQLGVVTGTALDLIFARRLQDGDLGGHMRHGLDQFPIPEIAERIWQTYYVPGGKAKTAAYKDLPKHSKDTTLQLAELCVVANFVEVLLARTGHDNPVGINYLERVQLPHLPSIYGAMLAGVGYVLMGQECHSKFLACWIASQITRLQPTHCRSRGHTMVMKGRWCSRLASSWGVIFHH